MGSIAYFSEASVIVNFHCHCDWNERGLGHISNADLCLQACLQRQLGLEGSDVIEG